MMKFFGVERPDPFRPQLQALVDVAPSTVRSQASDLLNRYDNLARASDSLCSNPFGARLWLASVDELLAKGQHVLSAAPDE
ncbi:hypothetical protein [Mycobacterium avium]|uniref:hypothetical protein n=1 Tax=Mycobacterium avium TaxID=1764 RepID=UPI001155A7CA|nr:hypothetical protein [Mycobacterium avium]